MSKHTITARQGCVGMSTCSLFPSLASAGGSRYFGCAFADASTEVRFSSVKGPVSISGISFSGYAAF
jgi:hypothetical protein